MTALLLTGCASNRFGSYKPNTKSRTSRPYTIKGVTYYPQSTYEYEETGKASFYGDGDGFHGKKTSTGEVFNAYAMTAAHKTLPLPSVVEVTNLENGKKVKLKVNDRGPFIKGRIIDVSTAAAKKLGFYKQGLANVRVRTLVAETKKVNQNPNFWRQAVYRQSSNVPIRNMLSYQTKRAARPAHKRPTYMAYGYAKPQMKPKILSVKGIKNYATETAALSVAKRKHYIQAGVFSTLTNALNFKKQLKKAVPSSVIQIQQHPSKPLKRVRIGPFHSLREAQKQLERFKQCGCSDLYVVQS